MINMDMKGNKNRFTTYIKGAAGIHWLGEGKNLTYVSYNQTLHF